MPVNTAPKQRYLSVEGKRRELEEFRRLRQRRNPHQRIGGRGLLDHDIHPLCDALNEMEGLCTLQSCAGHALDESDGTSYPGMLWVWLSHDMAAAFDARAFDLSAACPGLVDAVTRRYQPYGREIVEIVFQGNDRGRLGESAAFILRFFRSLAQEVQQRVRTSVAS